jgi:hypothetical protein
MAGFRLKKRRNDGVGAGLDDAVPWIKRSIIPEVKEEI